MKKIIIVLLSVSLVSLAAVGPEMFFQQRTIEFSGYGWQVRNSPEKRSLPGPNLWSGKQENVWVDEKGRLHLKLTSEKGKWYSSEVTMTSTLGYGEYVFYISLPPTLNRNAVLGMFNYHDDEHEIAIELSRWGQKASHNAQYVVQPVEQPVEISERLHRFTYDDSFLSLTHKFIWQPNRIDFMSYRQHRRSPQDPELHLQQWSYQEDDVPQEYPGSTGHLNVHINLWLQNGTPPSDGKDVEVIIDRFEYYPLSS